MGLSPAQNVPRETLSPTLIEGDSEMKSEKICDKILS